MAGKKKTAPVPKKLPQPVPETGATSPARVTRGRTHPGGASFPVAPPRADLPRGYAKTLGEIKQRIQQERLRVVLAANTAMVLLYWDIGRVILDRQEREGWGAKVIDRLAGDLREAFPDMKGFSPRNLKYMRAFAAAWPDGAIVQEALAQIPWYHHIALMELKAVPFDPGFVGQLNMYLSAVDDLLRHPDDKPAIGLLLCRAKDRFIVEYALRDLRKPFGVAGWETTLVEKLPQELRGSLPTVEEIEAELAPARRPGTPKRRK